VTTYRGDRFESFSIASFKRVADDYAAWYYGNGIREKDPVAVYLGEGVLNLIHFSALTSLGAIPILVNGNMRPHLAAGFARKTGAVAIFSDTDHLAAMSPHLDPDFRAGLRFLATDQTAAQLGEPRLPARFPFVHADEDPVLVGHSSGTTGIPKAVVFLHQQFFHGIRYRLSQPRLPGSTRILSALPHSHSAGIAYVMLAVLSGTPVLVLSSNRPEIVLPAIADFRPTMVAAFPQTYVELTEADYQAYDLDSVRVWVNGGDAAHERHIRKLISLGSWTRGGETLRGSLFIDGLGSSEMGFSLFRAVHTPETNHYNRCIGSPLEWVDAAVLGPDGEKLPPYRIGRLGVRAPSVTAGYWNDSVLTARTRVSGYWLTGDLFYYDEQSRFYHVDRTPDAIPTRDGMVYSLQTEEVLMKHCEVLADCTVIGVPVEGGTQVPVALVRLETGAEEPPDLLDQLNRALVAAGLRPSLVKVLQPALEDLPLGPTGKVLKREARDRYRNLFTQGENHA
jgi:acyl-CoA synthetase (AMP-forming)/AMP-acid ligase II